VKRAIGVDAADRTTSMPQPAAIASTARESTHAAVSSASSSHCAIRVDG
jgi:hypothetical protein